MAGIFNRRKLTAHEAPSQRSQLQDFKTLAFTGDSDIPVEATRILDAEQKYHLGSVGRFTDPVLGLGLYTYTQLENSQTDGKPVPVYAGVGIKATTDITKASSSAPIGVLFTDRAAESGDYAWILDEGLNPLEIELPASAKRGDSIGVLSNGMGVTGSNRLGVVIDDSLIVEEDEKFIAKPGAIRFGVSRNSLSREVFELRQELFTQLDIIQQAPLDGRVVTRADIDKLINDLSLMLGEDLSRVERATYLLSQEIRSITDDEVLIARQQILAAVANFERLAETHAGNAEAANTATSYLAAAVNIASEAARVYQNEAGVFAESSQESANIAVVRRNESEGFAQASAVSAQEAEASSTAAGESASAALTSETNAATSAGEAEGFASSAGTSASQASESESNAAGSAASASLSEGAAADSATQAGGSATAAGNSATTATTQANEAGVQAGIATNQAGIATAKAGDAATQAGFAQQFKVDAEAAAGDSTASSVASASSALTAATSSAASRLAALSQYSTRTNSLDDWQYDGDVRDPLSGIPPIGGPQIVNDSSLGPTIEQTTVRLAMRAPLPCVVGRKYRFRLSTKNLGAANSQPRWLIYPRLADNSSAGAAVSLFGSMVGPGSVSSIDQVLDCDTFLAANPNTKFIFPVLVQNPGSAGRVGRVIVEDVTESTRAETAASASVTQADSAETSRDEAAGFAATASTQADLAVSAKNESVTAAGASAGSAVSADESRAASQTIFENVASLRSNALNKNAGFDDYPGAAVGAIPTGWGVDPVNIGSGYRVPGPTGGYSWRLSAAAFTEVYGRMYSEPGSVSQGEYLIIRGEVTVNSGSLQGSGILVSIRDAAGGYAGQNLRLDFFTEADASGVAVEDHPEYTVVGKTYRFEKKVQITTAPTASRFFVAPMNHWNDFGHTLQHTNDLTWHECSVSPPTAADATVGILTGAIVGPDGPAAILELFAAASGSEPAKFRMKAGVDGSAIGIVAESITMGNGEDVIVVEGNVARINNSLLRRAKVAPTEDSDIFLDIQLKPLEFMESHGATIVYQNGASFGEVPVSSVDTSGVILPALPVGEAYDIRTINRTATQCQLKAVKTTAGGAAAQSSGTGTNVGGNPQWRASKSVAANAYNGEYSYSFTATLARQGSTSVIKVNELDSSTWKYTTTYVGQAILKGLVGSTWVTLKTANLSRVYRTTGNGGAGHDATKSFGIGELANSSSNFGSGSNRFGVHPGTGTTITAFAGVTWATQTGGTETPLGGLFKVIIHPPNA